MLVIIIILEFLIKINILFGIISNQLVNKSNKIKEEDLSIIIK
jgi:hypothetical protein